MSQELIDRIDRLQAAVDKNTAFTQAVSAHVAALTEAVNNSVNEVDADVLAHLDALSVALESNNASLDAADGVDDPAPAPVPDTPAEPAPEVPTGN